MPFREPRQKKVKKCDVGAALMKQISRRNEEKGAKFTKNATGQVLPVFSTREDVIPLLGTKSVLREDPLKEYLTHGSKYDYVEAYQDITDAISKLKKSELSGRDPVAEFKVTKEPTIFGTLGDMMGYTEGFDDIQEKTVHWDEPLDINSNDEEIEIPDNESDDEKSDMSETEKKKIEKKKVDKLVTKIELDALALFKTIPRIGYPDGICEIPIPNPPQWEWWWDGDLLHHLEEIAFETWRRKLASWDPIVRARSLRFTVYEQNLNYWRQLWQVIDRSHTLVYVIDARWPEFFRCLALEKMIKEKHNNTGKIILLANKADLVPPSVRSSWSQYWQSNNIEVIYFSALYHMESMKFEDRPEESENENTEEINEQEEIELQQDLDQDEKDYYDANKSYIKPRKQRITKLVNPLQKDLTQNSLLNSTGPDDEINSESEHPDIKDKSESINKNLVKESPTLSGKKYEYSADEVICCHIRELMKKKQPKKADEFLKVTPEETLTCGELGSYTSGSDLYGPERLIEKLKLECENKPVGFIGYPNVGKSSLLNALVGEKCVATSSTPGKTKHFQTVRYDSVLSLLDCPGLVFPQVISQAVPLALRGLEPIHEVRDVLTPANTLVQYFGLAELIDKLKLEKSCAQLLLNNKDQPIMDPGRFLLEAFALKRNVLTSSHNPDVFWAGKFLMTKYLNGALVQYDDPNKIPCNEKVEESIFFLRKLVRELEYILCEQEALRRKAPITKRAVRKLTRDQHGKALVFISSDIHDKTLYTT